MLINRNELVLYGDIGDAVSNKSHVNRVQNWARDSLGRQNKGTQARM